MAEKSKKIVIDRDVCISCGACVNISPEHFRLNEDDFKSEVIKQYDEKDKDVIEEAVNNCPVGAISLK